MSVATPLSDNRTEFCRTTAWYTGLFITPYLTDRTIRFSAR